ncbi:protein LTV1 homolog [Melitaea cinxia]|uniref:protein LTV1 homolog n=1 Tax=Melitaea cinxia TaxID=113334 RepID=UPI001E270FD1|nr:protein LTV1 homolog [Melitaea cinxia]
MPKTKKKFIDRKKAVTFNLVHRSQRDPLVADETAPQRVLVPVNANVPPRKEKDPELSTEQRKEEQKKYGIYFDDDYNYLQHLKDTKEVTLVLQPKATHKRKEKRINTNIVENENELETDAEENIKLPSSVFASAVEEDVGLLNKAASQGLCLDLDPEVVAALDEDFDFEDPDNQLEDNFIELAMGDEGSDIESDEEGSRSGNDDSDKAFASDLDSDDDSDQSQERRPKMPSWGEKDDTKSRFSQYSMSSSVIRRNEGLSLLDNRFEKMFEEYDDTEVGALDLEEIEGFMPETHDMLLRAAEEFEESQKRYKLDKEKEIARIQRLQEIEEESEEDDLVTMEVEPKEKWDCETILSTYSNLYNHPKVIEEPKKPKKIKINPKTGIPEETLGKDNKLTMKSLAKFNAMNNASDNVPDEDGRTNAETVMSTLSILSIRPKEETPEEKKERKRLLKEYRKERRIEKKANKEAFKEEKKRQEKIMLNNRNNVQGNRIL